MIDPQLEHKVVLITGANHGIGAATAQAFAAQGASIFITYYRDVCRYPEADLQQAYAAGTGGDRLYRAMQQQPAEPLVEMIRAQGGVAMAHEMDLADAANIPRLFDACEASLGPVDVLVNNHTYCVLETFDPALVTDAGSGIHLLSTAQIDAHFAINARAYALLMAEYLQRHLRRQATWGRIINVSTVLVGEFLTRRGKGCKMRLARRDSRGFTPPCDDPDKVQRHSCQNMLEGCLGLTDIPGLPEIAAR